MEQQPRFLIGGLAVALTWLEELISMLSGPFLTVGAGIALVALLTDGALLLQQPWLTTAYGISQAVGVDGMLIGSAFLLARAWANGHVGAVVGNLLLIVMLAYVVFLGGLVFNFTQAFHVSSTIALASLNIDKTNWLWQRTAVGVALVILSGLRRYQPKVAIDVEAQLREIAAKKRLDDAKRIAAAERFAGWKTLAQQTLRPAPASEEPAPSMSIEAEAAIAEEAATPVPSGHALMTTAEMRDYAARILGVSLKDSEAIAIMKTVAGVTRLPAVGARKPWAAPREAVIAQLHTLYDASALVVAEAVLAE